MRRKGPSEGRGLLDAHSVNIICFSVSFQALIFKRKQTQHKRSDCSVAPAVSQTRQAKVFSGLGSKTVI